MIFVNRIERRRAIKTLQKYGINRDTADKIVQIRTHATNTLQAGDIVKINVDRIQKSKSWTDGTYNPKYVDFINENADCTFTVENSEQPMLYTLMEDTSEVKWFWFASDLIKINPEVYANE